MRISLVALSVSALLWFGCARRQAQRNGQQNSTEQTTSGPVSPPTITKVAGALPELEVARPSPFDVHPEADREQAVPAPVSVPLAKSAGDLGVARKPLKAFNLASIEPKDKLAPLPPPPELPAARSNAAPLSVFEGGSCCVGTATAEPARPARLKRVLQKIPGLRRIRQSPQAEDGYVPPKLARRITFVLPPESRAVLSNGTMDVKATVNESGDVTRVELLSPRDEELVRLASYAANSWRFVPARLNDKTVASEVILHFSF